MGGGELKPKSLPWEGYGYFQGLHIWVANGTMYLKHWRSRKLFIQSQNLGMEFVMSLKYCFCEFPQVSIFTQAVRPGLKFRLSFFFFFFPRSVTNRRPGSKAHG